MSVAWADNTTQTLDGTIKPRQPGRKKNFKGASVNIDVLTDTTPPGGVLDPANQAVIESRTHQVHHQRHEDVPSC